MLKRAIRSTFLTKFNNATFCCLRHFYERNIEMQQGQGYQPKSNLNPQNCGEEDQLSNIRKWIPIEQTNKQGFLFTVFNYNILSQNLLEAHSYLYQHHVRNSLNWNTRLYNIIGEIFRTKPSILCCQEVQCSHISQIQSRLQSMNYGMLFKKRTGDKPDGCAIFYRTNLFHLLEEHNVEFEQPGVEILNRENVAIIAKLCLKSDPSIQFLVATTHLLYNPRRQDIRLAQIQVLLTELDRHAERTDRNGHKTYLPVILTGDFNLKPYSAPFNFITNGILDYASLSSRTLQNQKGSSNQTMNGRQLLPIKLGIRDDCQHHNREIKLYHSENNKVVQHFDKEPELTRENVNMFQTGVLRHNFDFKSVYHQINENFVSTYHQKWVLVDYIFYSDKSKRKSSNDTELQLLNFLSLPTQEECERLRLKIPNSFSGSDHLSLAAQFKLCFNDNNDLKGASTKL